MGKNKDDEDTDKFSALEILIGFHSIMIQSLPRRNELLTKEPSKNTSAVIAKLEEHILDLLNQLDFSTEEQETEE